MSYRHNIIKRADISLNFATKTKPFSSLYVHDLLAYISDFRTKEQVYFIAMRALISSIKMQKLGVTSMVGVTKE